MEGDRLALIFPDGTIMSGFQWSIMGYYYKEFPESGIHSAQVNCLKFTRKALEQAHIRIGMNVQ